MFGDQVAIRCVFMRGGSSRGAVLLSHDLPSEPELRDRVVLAIYGSPDVRQINGLGGADPLTSKVAVVSRSAREGIDVDYTFGQVRIDQPEVLWVGNCGNLSSAIGPFAVDEGLVPVVEPVTTVRIYNTNTDKVIEAEVPVVDGRAATVGDCAIGGVPGTGAAIPLNFLNSEGSVTGKLLPTDRPRDRVTTADGREYEVSIVDAATPFVFVAAEALGFTGTESASEIDAHATGRAQLEAVRAAAARLLGVVKADEDAATVSPSLPRVAMVAAPIDHELASGERVSAGQITIVARQQSMQRTHKAYAVTGAICLGAAVRIPGTVANEMASPVGADETVRIAHPSGSLDVQIRVSGENGDLHLPRAALVRTARRIMDGVVYVPRHLFVPPTGATHS